MPHAADMHRYAILGPTPGKEVSSEMLDGISEEKLSRSINAVALMKRVLLLWNPTFEINESRCVGDAAMMLAMVKVDGRV